MRFPGRLCAAVRDIGGYGGRNAPRAAVWRSGAAAHQVVACSRAGQWRGRFAAGEAARLEMRTAHFEMRGEEAAASPPPTEEQATAGGDDGGPDHEAGEPPRVGIGASSSANGRDAASRHGAGAVHTIWGEPGCRRGAGAASTACWGYASAQPGSQALWGGWYGQIALAARELAQRRCLQQEGTGECSSGTAQRDRLSAQAAGATVTAGWPEQAPEQPALRTWASQLGRSGRPSSSCRPHAASGRLRRWPRLALRSRRNTARTLACKPHLAAAPAWAQLACYNMTCANSRLAGAARCLAVARCVAAGSASGTGHRRRRLACSRSLQLQHTALTPAAAEECPAAHPPSPPAPPAPAAGRSRAH